VLLLLINDTSNQDGTSPPPSSATATQETLSIDIIGSNSVRGTYTTSVIVDSSSGVWNQGANSRGIDRVRFTGSTRAFQFMILGILSIIIDIFRERVGLTLNRMGIGALKMLGLQVNSWPRVYVLGVSHPQVPAQDSWE